MFIFIFDLVICGLGVLLILLNFFPIKNGILLDMDIIGYIGILMICIGSIHGLFFLNKKIKQQGFRYISSKYLPLTKFYMPVIVSVLLLFDIILICFNLYPGDNIAIFIVLGLMFLGWLLLLVPEMCSKTICIKGNLLLVTNYFRSFNLQLNEIQEIKRSFYLTYVIKTNNSNYPRILFRPVLQVVGPLTLFVTPESIKKIRILVDKSKNMKK
jgi:hypothetical protein